MTSASVNVGPPVTYQYDADGLLVQAGEISLTRNLATGLLTGTQLGNVTTQRTYNALGELASETASYQGNVLSQVQYTRDKLGRIVNKVEMSEGVTTTLEYGYDLAGRLVEVKQNGIVTASYEYDANGNRIQALTSSQGMVMGSYDDQDRLIEYGGKTYIYTANAELLTKTRNGQTTTYHYEVLGNLRVVQLPEKTIEYVIDGRNRRVGKKVNGTLVQGFLYQGRLKPVAELDGNGNVVARFVYGSKANVPDYLVKEGKTYRILSDHLGSPRLVVDWSDGSVVQRLEYEAFGNVVWDTNPGFQPFGFAGGMYDVDTQLVRFGARDYEAESGRWTSKDPIGFAGGDSNLFGYVLNDPVNFLDLLGFDAIYINYNFYPVDTGSGFHAPLGHAGVVAVDPITGKTRYYEYGRYDKEDYGMVRRKAIPNVKIGETGLPTEESLENLYKYLSKQIGKGSHISATYYADSDYRATVNFAETFMKNPNRPKYNIFFNNCKTFANAAATACQEGQSCQ